MARPNENTWINWDDSKTDAENIAAGALLDMTKMQNIENDLGSAYDAAEVKVPTNFVTTAMFADSTISTVNIADGAVTSDKLFLNALTQAQIADGAITDNKISANAIATKDVVDNAINETHIAEGVIASIMEIADNAITTAKIQDGAVTSVKLSSTFVPRVHNENFQLNSITESKLADSSVAANRFASNPKLPVSKIADNSISASKFSTPGFPKEKFTTEVLDLLHKPATIVLNFINTSDALTSASGIITLDDDSTIPITINITGD